MSQDQLSLQQKSTIAPSSLDANQLALLQQTTASYSSLQLAWASGYLAAMSSTKSESGQSVQLSSALAVAAVKTLTILYASQTESKVLVLQVLAQN